MSGPDQKLLEMILKNVDSPRLVEVSGAEHWAHSVDENLSAWIKGQPGSHNRPRLANAIRAKAKPQEARNWWDKLLRNEEIGTDKVEEMQVGRGDANNFKNRVFYYNTAEPLSGIYWGWSLLGEVAALHFLSQRQSQPFEKTCEVLRRSIRRHIGMAALCAVSDLIIRESEDEEDGEDGDIIYRGPVVLSPGARTKGTTKSNLRGISTVFSYAIKMKPEIQRMDRLAKISEALPDEVWSLSDADRQQIRRFIHPNGPSAASAKHIVENLLPSTKTVVPFEFRRYDDRMIAVMAANCNGNSGATYYSEVFTEAGAEGGDVNYLYPYGGRTRVRQEHLIGAGSCRLEDRGSDGEFYVCENMTERERQKKGPKASRFQYETQLPDKKPMHVFRVNKTESLHLV